jgi:hypothetical protein
VFFPYRRFNIPPIFGAKINLQTTTYNPFLMDLSKAVFTILSLLMFIPAIFAQQAKTDSAKHVQDSIIVVKLAALDSTSRSIVDSQKVKVELLEVELKKLNDLKSKSTGEIDRLKKTMDDLLKSIKTQNSSLDTINDSIRSRSKTLGDMNKSLDSTRKQLDTSKKASTDLQKQITEKRDSIKTANQQLDQAIADLLKKEDSLEVISKIKLQPHIYIHLDRDGLVNKLNKEKDTAKRIMDMRVIGPGGFRLFDSATIDTMARTGSYDRIHEFRKEVKLREVRIDVNEGVIREILVKTTYGIYRNRTEPIDLVHIGRRLDDRLYRDGEDKYSQEYVVLGEVIEYEPTRSFNDIPYTQFDILLRNDTTKHISDSYTIRESTSINTYFDVAVFTDLQGIAGQANGLAQITANAKFITNTVNIRGSAVIPFNFVSFMGGLSKFDNSYKGTPISKDDSVNRKDLLQRANYYLGVKANLIHAILSPYPKRLIQDIQLNMGYDFVGSKLLRTTIKDTARPDLLDTTYTNATMNQFFIEPIISFTRYRNFNMAISVPLFWVNVKNSAGVKNSKTEFWARPSIELMYFSKRDSNSKLFFRYNHWINTKQDTNAFLQMQLGYSASISDLLKK